MKIVNQLLITFLLFVSPVLAKLSVDVALDENFTPLNHLNEKNLLAILNAIDYSDEPKMLLKPDISFLFADIKYDNGKLKILELGEGKNGGYRSFDAIFNAGDIWTSFWKYLKEFNVPIWFVGAKPAGNYYKVSQRDRLGWDAFKVVKGHHVTSISELLKDRNFKKLNKKRSQKNPEKIADYVGVIVFKYRDDRETQKLQELENFKKQFPHFLVLDRVSRPYAANKQLFNLLMQDEQLKQYRPLCKTYSKKYESGLAEKIIDDLQADIVVIKPVNSGMSNGVIIVDKEHLDVTLRKILLVDNDYHKNQRAFNYRPMNTVSYDYWKHDKNAEFLVEGYVPSKHLFIGGKEYDPTIRVVFVVSYDQGNISLKLLQAWWKLPQKALDEDGSLIDKHVSQYRSDMKTLPAKQLSLNQDYEDFKNLCEDVFPKMYLKMMKVQAFVDCTLAHD